MLKPKNKADKPSGNKLPQPTGRFYTVAKDSHLLYSAYQIDVVDGVVVEVKCLSRAPDLLASAVGYAQSELWAASKDQKSGDLDHE
jgi:hypothetical protein